MTGSDVRSDEIYTATPAHIGYEVYANTKPVALHYFDAKYPVKKWGLLYVKLAQCLYQDYPDVIEGLRGQSLFGENKRVDIADISFIGKMKQPRLLADDIYLETHLSATNTMRKIKKLLEFCRVDFENVIVSYVLSREAKSPSKKKYGYTNTPRMDTRRGRCFAARSPNGTAKNRSPNRRRSRGLSYVTAIRRCLWTND